jgi:putative transposase
MPRDRRAKVESGDAYYHIFCKVAGPKADYYPLTDDPAKRDKFIQLLNHFAQAYYCQLITYCVMGNHYHIVIRFDESFQATRQDLEARAALLYPNNEVWRKGWSDDHWNKFQNRLHDMSEFMRNVQQAFTRWVNKKEKTSGSFWRDRFKSVILADGDSVLDCALYVDLNPVRAGLVTRPEDWEGGAYFMRSIQQDQQLMSLHELMDLSLAENAEKTYREQLYYRGNVPSKEQDSIIPDHIVEREAERGFEQSGRYLKRVSYLSRGYVVGKRETVENWLDKLKSWGRLLCRERIFEAELVNGICSIRR